MHFCISKNRVPIIGSYETHGGNFITSKLIINILLTVLSVRRRWSPIRGALSSLPWWWWRWWWVCGISSWLRIRLLTRWIFSSVRALRDRRYLWLCCVSELFQQPASANFFVRHLFGNSFANSIALYLFNLLSNS